MDVQLLLVPYDTARRGWRCGAGPEHLMNAGLVDRLHAQGHRVVGTQLIDDDPAQSLAEIRTAFELMRRLATAVRNARAAGHFPLILSGNCNVAGVGALSGLTPAARSVFWFDAHGESNTPDTTGSGFLDGMGLSITLGWCWRAIAASVPGFQPVPVEATYLLGARDLDPLEAALLFDSRVNMVPVSRVSALPALLDPSATTGLRQTVGYLHLDPDVFDPDSVGTGNDHPAPGGLSEAQLCTAIAQIRGRVLIGAATIASYDPAWDRTQSVCRAVLNSLDVLLAPGG
jgi:arginase